MKAGFKDNTDDGQDNNRAAVLMQTLSAADFSTDTPFGLPRATITLLATDMLSALGLDAANTFGGDQFQISLELELTDGRIFNQGNAGGIITGGFFASPFRYNTPVVCPVEEAFFTGEYLAEQTAPSIFGYDTFDPDGGGVILELFNAATAPGAGLVQPAEAESLTSTQRAFDAFYLAALGFDNARTYILDYVCGEVVIPTGQTTGLTCGGPGITLGPPTGGNGTYDFMDDTVFQMNFTDDEAADCGGAAQAGIQFTKQ